MQLRPLLFLISVSALEVFAQECPYQTIAGMPVTFRGDNGPAIAAALQIPAALPGMPDGEDGKVADLNLKRAIHPVTVLVGSEDAEILYSGSAPGIVEGVTQINFRVPLLSTIGPMTIGLGVTEGIPQPNRLLFITRPEQSTFPSRSASAGPQHRGNAKR